MQTSLVCLYKGVEAFMVNLPALKRGGECFVSSEEVRRCTELWQAQSTFLKGPLENVNGECFIGEALPLTNADMVDCVTEHCYRYTEHHANDHDPVQDIFRRFRHLGSEP